MEDWLSVHLQALVLGSSQAISFLLVQALVLLGPLFVFGFLLNVVQMAGHRGCCRQPALSAVT